MVTVASVNWQHLETRRCAKRCEEMRAKRCEPLIPPRVVLVPRTAPQADSVP